MTSNQKSDGIFADVLVNKIPLKKYNSAKIEPINHLKRLVVKNHKHDPAYTNLQDMKYQVKYIEALSDKHFALRLIKEDGFARGCHHLGIRWEVDGRDTSIRHESINASAPDNRWHAECDSICTGDPQTGFYEHKFKFVKLKTTDGNGDFTEDQIQEIIQETEDLGTVRIYVYRMLDSPFVTVQPYFKPPQQAMEKLPEKALKMRNITHKVGIEQHRLNYGPPPRPEDSFQHPLSLPFIVFEFRYRSREGLIQERVIKQPPSIDNMNTHETTLFSPGLARNSVSVRGFDLRRKKSLLPLSMRKKGLLQYTPRTQPAAATRLKETLRQDGNVQIDLTSDNESDRVLSMESSRSTKRTRHGSNNNTMVADGGSVSAHSDQESQADGVPGSTPAHDIFVDEIPDRRARCETVEDEESLVAGHANAHTTSGVLNDVDEGWDSDKTLV